MSTKGSVKDAIRAQLGQAQGPGHPQFHPTGAPNPLGYVVEHSAGDPDFVITCQTPGLGFLSRAQSADPSAHPREAAGSEGQHPMLQDWEQGSGSAPTRLLGLKSWALIWQLVLIS